MGRVLIEYDPMRVCNAFIEKEEDTASRMMLLRE